jgi:hypothetical protein
VVSLRYPNSKLKLYPSPALEPSPITIYDHLFCPNPLKLFLNSTLPLLTT